jgi:hypothetical protein
VRLHQDLLQHQHVHIHHAVLQEMQRQHAHLVILAPVARQLLKTAAALGLTILPSIMVRADEILWADRGAVKLCHRQ